MADTIKLSKSEARRAMVAHHFAPAQDLKDAFTRLRSVQFDPIAPVGCNHDLVLQARVPGYRMGDWQDLAYKERFIYDGWDKQACLIPMEGWPVRRIVHQWLRERNPRVFDQHPEAIEAILKELHERGPLMPKECEFQIHKPEWKDSWHGPNLSKQALRALWYTGRVMTSGRKGGHHIYDLTERIVPEHLFNQPPFTEEQAIAELVLERHRAVGLLRPTASFEVWSLYVKAAKKHAAIEELIKRGDLLPVEVEGVKAHVTPALLQKLDQGLVTPSVVFIAPLDPFIWDRSMIKHLFDFDYIWEIYTPEPKRKWGYYVLPILFGDDLVARVEFWCRKGVLNIRAWHFEAKEPPNAFFINLKPALKAFMDYCSANKLEAASHVDARIRDLAESLNT